MPQNALPTGIAMQFNCSRCKTCCYCMAKNDTSFLIECIKCKRSMHPTCQTVPASSSSSSSLETQNATRPWECYVCIQKSQQQIKVLPGAKTTGKSLLLGPVISKSKNISRPTIIVKKFTGLPLVKQHLLRNPKVCIVSSTSSTRKEDSLLQSSGKATANEPKDKNSTQSTVTMHNIQTGGVSLLKPASASTSTTKPVSQFCFYFFNLLNLNFVYRL